MRILPISKLDQILRSSRPRIRGRTGSNEVIGNLETSLSARYHKGLTDGHERGYSLIHDIRVGFSQAEVWKVFTVLGRRFMVTIPGAPNSTGSSPAQVLHHEGFVSLFQIWRALRLKEFDSLYQGVREFSYRKCHPGIYWRPAVFVSLADKKGQMLLQSLALLVGEACHQGHKAPAAAEQVYGSWELTSQTHETSFKSVFNESKQFHYCSG